MLSDILELSIRLYKKWKSCFQSINLANLMELFIAVSNPRQLLKSNQSPQKAIWLIEDNCNSLGNKWLRGWEAVQSILSINLACTNKSRNIWWFGAIYIKDLIILSVLISISLFI